MGIRKSEFVTKTQFLSFIIKVNSLNCKLLNQAKNIFYGSIKLANTNLRQIGPGIKMF